MLPVAPGEGTTFELTALLLPSGDNAATGSTEPSAPTFRKDRRLRESPCGEFKCFRLLAPMDNFSRIWDSQRTLFCSRTECNRPETGISPCLAGASPVKSWPRGFFLPGTPEATARRQSGWGTSLPLPCPEHPGPLQLNPRWVKPYTTFLCQYEMMSLD